MNLTDFRTSPLSQVIEAVSLGFDIDAEQKAIARDRILTEWNEAATELARVKAKENELRLAAVKLLSDPTKLKGTENVELGNGYKLKIVKKENFSFVKNPEGKTDTVAINNVLAQLSESMGTTEIAARLVEYKPEFKVSEYNRLTIEQKKLVDKVLVVSPGTPTLEVVAPKGK